MDFLTNPLFVISCGTFFPLLVINVRKTSSFQFGSPAGCMRAVTILLCAAISIPLSLLGMIIGGLVVSALHIPFGVPIFFPVVEVVGIAMGLILGSVWTDIYLRYLRRYREKNRGW